MGAGRGEKIGGSSLLQSGGSGVICVFEGCLKFWVQQPQTGRMPCVLMAREAASERPLLLLLLLPRLLVLPFGCRCPRQFYQTKSLMLCHLTDGIYTKGSAQLGDHVGLRKARVVWHQFPPELDRPGCCRCKLFRDGTMASRAQTSQLVRDPFT